MSDVSDILQVAEKLDINEQLSLLEQLVHIIRKKEDKNPSATLSSLSGTGASLWQGVNIDNYIENERQW